MKKAEIRTLIYSEMGKVLAGTAFRLKKSEEGFVRKIENGRQTLGVPLWDYNPVFEFSFNICIRLEAVEEIFHRFSGSPPKYHSLSYSAGTRLEYFTSPAKYRAATDLDVISAFASLSEVLLKKIIPFLDCHQNVQQLDALVNPVNEPEVKFDIFQNPAGAMDAVIIAYLAGNKKLNDLIIRKRREMALEPTAESPFNQLVEYLMSKK